MKVDKRCCLRSGLRKVKVDGVTLDEGGPVVGVLLDQPEAASGLAPVMVTLR